MKNLTEKQRNILDFIEDFTEKEGMSPTVYEIADYFNIKTSTVFAHIRALQRKNELTRSSKARSIALTKPRKRMQNLIGVTPIPVLNSFDVELPIAEQPDKASDICVDPGRLGTTDLSKVFAYSVKDYTMRDLGIYEGDIVILKAVENVNAGDIVLANIDGELTIRTYYPLKGGRVEMRPANPDCMSQVYPGFQVQVLGVVAMLHREY